MRSKFIILNSLLLLVVVTFFLGLKNSADNSDSNSSQAPQTISIQNVDFHSIKSISDFLVKASELGTGKGVSLYLEKDKFLTLYNASQPLHADYEPVIVEVLDKNFNAIYNNAERHNSQSILQPLKALQLGSRAAGVEIVLIIIVFDKQISGDEALPILISLHEYGVTHLLITEH